MAPQEAPQPESPPDNTPAAGPVAPRRRGRWLKIFGFVIVGLFLLLSALPTLFSLSPLRHEFPRMRLRGFVGNIRVEKASLSWWGPTILEGVELDDLDGNLFTKIRYYIEYRSVIDMIFRREGPVVIHAEGAEITVVLRPDGSNVEEAMRPVVEYHKRRPKRDRSIEVVDSVLHVTDSTNGNRADWEKIALKIHNIPVPASDNTFELVATYANSPDGKPIHLDYRWKTPSGDSAVDDLTQHVHLQADDLPLRFLSPLYSRMAADLDLSGSMTTDLKIGISEGAEGMSGFDAKGRLLLENLALACPSRLGADRVELSELRLQGSLSAGGGQCRAEDLEIHSELGHILANGSFPLRSLSASDQAEVADRLQEGDFKLKGELDLVQIAQRLPETLRLKSGARLTEGKLTIDVACHGGEPMAHWIGNLETSRLAGEVDGHQVAWDQPVKLNFDIARGSDRFEIEKFDCRSDVLQMTAHGNSDGAHLEATCDLAKLTGQLGRFVDLQDRRWQGSLTTRVDFRRDEDRELAIASRSTVDNFSVSKAEQTVWSEPHLLTDLTCRLADERLRPRRISSLLITVTGEDEHDWIKATLSEPVDLSEKGRAWPLALEMSGDLARWRSRLQRQEPSVGWAIEGAFKSSSQVRITDTAIDFDQLAVDLTGFHLTAQDLDLTEPVVRITGIGQWDRAARRVKFPTLEWGAASGRINGTDIEFFRSGEGHPVVSGRFALDSDLALLNPPDTAPDERPWQGAVHASLNMSHQAGRTEGTCQIDLENLVIRKQRTRLVERRRGDIEKITIDAPPIDVPRPPPGTIVDRRMRRAIEKAEREARRESERREKAARKLADEIVMVPTTEWKTVWTDPKLTFRGTGRYDSSNDVLELDQVGIETAGLNWSAQGKLTDASTQAIIDLAGNVDYDAAVLLDRLQDSIGRFVKLTAKERRPFSLQGPLKSKAPAEDEAIVSRELKGAASAGWESGNLFGLDAGPGELQFQLSDAVLAMQPLSLALSGGKLHLAPEVHLTGRPAMLHLPKGSVLENVALTQEVCDGWLKFIAPALSEATRAEGRFSLALEESQLPLSDLSSGSMAGQLQIESAQVLPGPLFGEIAGFLGQIEATVGRGAGGLLSPDQPLMIVDRQTVNFQLREGRLYHSPMTFNVKGVPVRTRGSVGADQSLDLLAEIMFPAPWARRVPLIAHLDGKVFEVPIRGTLRHPKVDGQAIGKAWEQFGLDVLDNLLNGGLIPR